MAVGLLCGCGSTAIYGGVTASVPKDLALGQPRTAAVYRSAAATTLRNLL